MTYLHRFATRMLPKCYACYGPTDEPGEMCRFCDMDNQARLDAAFEEDAWNEAQEAMEEDTKRGEE